MYDRLKLRFTLAERLTARAHVLSNYNNAVRQSYFYRVILLYLYLIANFYAHKKGDRARIARSWDLRAAKRRSRGEHKLMIYGPWTREAPRG